MNKYISLTTQLRTRLKTQGAELDQREAASLAPEWLLGGDDLNRIGGRATDISQIANSLRRSIKDAYAINSVPDEILTSLELLTVEYIEAEANLEELILEVTRDLVMKQIQAEKEAEND